MISVQEITKAYGAKTLFEGLSFSIEFGERIGLIGPNGAGKSTLFAILAGQETMDSGKISKNKGLRIGFLHQSPDFSPHSTIGSCLSESGAPSNKIFEVTSKLGLSHLESETPLHALSGGWRKRVALARELARDPELLLLDEPTNHLDIESILWLEDRMNQWKFATMTITHDRLFLGRVANRIIEINKRHKNGILSVQGDYLQFLKKREEILGIQKLHESKLRNTLRREQEWLSRGPQARQTKQKARIDAADDLAKEVSDLETRNRQPKVQMNFVSTQKTPKNLVEAKNISKSYSSGLVIPNLNLVLTPRTRVGLMGPNGCGKSTLIRLLTGNEEPDAGTIRFSEKLKISYFEQNRESLDPQSTVKKVLCPAGDRVVHCGNEVHVKSYLSKFLFAYDQMDAQVSKLSGGEQSRLLLARLMLQETNLLVLDEPTNDLDIDTLDVLANVLDDFEGAVLLVTHDRFFLDQISNLILAFGSDRKGNKIITPLVGLSQWEHWRNEQNSGKGERSLKGIDLSIDPQDSKKRPKPKKKLSYKDQRELETLPAKIQVAELRLAQLTANSQSPELSPTQRTALAREMSALQIEIENMYQLYLSMES